MIRAAIRARVRRIRSDERGVSLVELLVAIFLFLILSSMVGAMFVSVTRSVSVSHTVDNDTRSASNGMNEVTRMVRAATENPIQSPAAGAYPNESAIQAADNRTITLYAFVNLESSSETPVKVKFWVNANNQLVETRWPATTIVNGHWSFSSTALGDRILCDSIVPNTPLFSYLLDGGSVITIPSGGIVNNDIRLTIRAVTVTIPVETPNVQTMAVTLKSIVSMPNLGLSKTASGVTGP